MDNYNLWGAKVLDYSNDSLFNSHQYTQAVTGCLRLTTGVRYSQYLTVKPVDASREQLYLSRIFNSAALEELLHDFELIPSTIKFCLSVVFAIPPVCTLRYLSKAIEERADCLGFITLRHHSHR